MMQYYIYSLDNDKLLADITKSATVWFRFDVIQGPVLDMR